MGAVQASFRALTCHAQRLPPSSIVKKTQALKIVGITTIDLAGVVHKVYVVNKEDTELHVLIVAAVAETHHKELI